MNDTQQQQRAEQFDRLRTLRGALVALNLAMDTTDEIYARAADQVQANIREGEAWHVLAGAIGMVLAVAGLLSEATAETEDPVTVDDVIAHLEALVVQQIHDSAKALQALDRETGR